MRLMFGENDAFPVTPAVKSIRAVMQVAHNINIRFEKGVFRVSAEIPVANAREAIESLVEELNWQLLGEERSTTGQTVNIVPKMLNERDAATYIGRTASFLRSCRYKAKKGEIDYGPRYVRYRNKLIFYPVNELDDWLNRNQRFSTCFEEKVYAESGQILNFPNSSMKDEVIQNA